MQRQLSWWWQGIALVVAVVGLAPSITAAQSAACGSIIRASGAVEAVTDCDNPLGQATGWPHTLTIGDTVVTPGMVLVVAPGAPIDLSLTPVRQIIDGDHQSALYRHTTAGYEYVNLAPEIDFSNLPEEPMRTFAATYFTDDTDPEPFIQASLSEDAFSAALDTLSEEDKNILFDFYEELAIYLQTILRPLWEPGTYTLVAEEQCFFLSHTQPSWWQILQEFFLPVAYAEFLGDCAPPEGWYTITFTITTEPIEPPPPLGASSVLFLPGILGSRLFEDSAACADEFGVQERWPSRSDCAQFRLKTDFMGQSLHEIYTVPGADGILDQAYTQDVYVSLLQDLRQWESAGQIAEYALVPYDWRMSIPDILKSKLDTTRNRIIIDRSIDIQESHLYKELARLAESSASGKVTVLAHSNGGLVAKQFVRELQLRNDPLLEKIDTLILVAVPQVGTPDAVWALLHGTYLGPFGFVLSNETSRQLLNTMAFAHHLLPNQRYFDRVRTPVIMFEPGELTDDWVQAYGTVTTRDQLFDFIDKNSGREKPAPDDLLTPEIVDPFLLNYAKVTETAQNNWNPPADLAVLQIAGTGLDTPGGLTYFTDRECVRRNPLALFRCEEFVPKLSYRVNTVVTGDATVVEPSAHGIDSGEVDLLWVDIDAYNDTVIFDRKHSDILEIDELRNVIFETIQGTSTGSDYAFISTTPPDFTNESRMVLQLHSPLDMWIEVNGEVVSSSTSGIAGAQYRRFGELQFISVPANQGDFTVNLYGLAEGSFTLDIDRVVGTELVERQSFSAIPSTVGTNVALPISVNGSFENLVLVMDYDGDGNSDVEYTTNGEIVKVDFNTLKTAIQGLVLRPILKQPLLVITEQAARFAEKKRGGRLALHLLQLLEQMLSKYERRNILTQESVAPVKFIIDNLKEQV
jgi:pimeloyl-ACP methyl ester carboxylesterase